jgi:lactate dehydrogenase-like 2-hydroxyacid dehydrogenase
MTELPPETLAALQRQFGVRCSPLGAPARVIVEASQGCFAVIAAPGAPMPAETIEALPATVRAIVSFSAGLDHIDLPAARARNLLVTNTPDVLTNATADCAMLLLLMAARGATEAERTLRGGEWAGWRPSDIRGVDLFGKTLALIGYGRIGQAFAKRAAAFGLEIAFWDRHGKGATDDLATPVKDLHTLLAQAHILSLHAPSTPDTRHIINAERLAAMRRGVILINTARGDLLNDDAVIAAVKSGWIGGLGLDVYTNEPKFHPAYLGLPRTSLLPHVGSATTETREAMGAKVIENLVAISTGLRPPDLVA